MRATHSSLRSLKKHEKAGPGDHGWAASSAEEFASGFVVIPTSSLAPQGPPPLLEAWHCFK